MATHAHGSVGLLLDTSQNSPACAAAKKQRTRAVGGQRARSNPQTLLPRRLRVVNCPERGWRVTTTSMHPESQAQPEQQSVPDCERRCSPPQAPTCKGVASWPKSTGGSSGAKSSVRTTSRSPAAPPQGPTAHARIRRCCNSTRGTRVLHAAASARGRSPAPASLHPAARAASEQLTVVVLDLVLALALFGNDEHCASRAAIQGAGGACGLRHARSAAHAVSSAVSSALRPAYLQALTVVALLCGDRRAAGPGAGGPCRSPPTHPGHSLLTWPVGSSKTGLAGVGRRCPPHPLRAMVASSCQSRKRAAPWSGGRVRQSGHNTRPRATLAHAPRAHARPQRLLHTIRVLTSGSGATSASCVFARLDGAMGPARAGWRDGGLSPQPRLTLAARLWAPRRGRLRTD